MEKNKQAEAAIKKQASDSSKQSQQKLLGNIAENDDALSAKNVVLDNDSQENVVNASPLQ